MVQDVEAPQQRNLPPQLESLALPRQRRSRWSRKRLSARTWPSWRPNRPDILDEFLRWGERVAGEPLYFSFWALRHGLRYFLLVCQQSLLLQASLALLPFLATSKLYQLPFHQSPSALLASLRIQNPQLCPPSSPNLDSLPTLK